MNLPVALTRERTLELLAEYRVAIGLERDRLETELVEGNLRFCWTTARRYTMHGVEMEDLFAEARAALLIAIRRFNLGQSRHFAQYAARCMRRDLISLIQRLGGPVRARKRIRGRPLQIPGALSLDHEPDSSAERILGPSDSDPVGEALARIDAERLTIAIDALPERDGTVVRMRFGLAGVAPHELAEIGAVLGVSKQRAQAILIKALATLRVALREAA